MWLKWQQKGLPRLCSWLPTWQTWSWRILTPQWPSLGVKWLAGNKWAWGIIWYQHTSIMEADSVLGSNLTAAAGPSHSQNHHIYRTVLILMGCRCQHTALSQIPAHLKAQEIPVTTVRLPATTATLADHLPNKARTTVDQRNWNNPQCWHDLSGSEHSAGPC